jgi:alpha-beta hydrolase superfamily lysophospholipase
MMPTHREHRLFSADGTRLTAQVFSPARAEHQLLVVPGYGEHALRYRMFAHAMAEVGLETWALDLRGHGHSAGQRGHVSTFDRYLDDVAAALAALDRPLVLGHSHGGLVVLDYLGTRQHAVRAAVVTNPFLALAMPVPEYKLRVARVAARLMPRLPIPSEIPPSYLTRVQAIVDAYERDRLVFRVATAGWFQEVTVAQKRVQGMTSVGTPLLYVYSDGDKIAAPGASERLSGRIEGAEVWRRTGEFHEVLNEEDRAALHRAIGVWLLDKAARSLQGAAP